MERREDLPNALIAFSEGLADLVEWISPVVVRVDGRRRRSGSGVVFAPGMVLTASHVLEREEDLSVATHDGRTLGASFAGRDRATDLAVMRVEDLEMEAAIPVKREARVGELALTVGRTRRNQGPKASLGIVSAVGGPLRGRWGMRLERYVQTDAAPYPGLSGGPLVGARGDVLGVVTTGLARGASLGIPAELAWRVAGTLLEKGSIRRGYLGLLSQPVRLPDSQGADLGQRIGLLVGGVEDGSPAGNGGLMLGDILMKLDGHPVEDTEDLLALLTSEMVGREVPVQVLRGGEAKTLHVTVGERG